ncbi:uncharacterized protein EAF02_007706 [Botrytis sinoallii]|uniref:uncharacterized protein n=1 Tax=Botrytis sinoallii TaxID=1463999 RepID=UPI001900CBFB|nr:uncharacterized protein EAF02_007706 [Botrytis sinoallii]KAF7880069.1 hypothetical protein EAF02_007706 [Botrytis sinoallii]
MDLSILQNLHTYLEGNPTFNCPILSLALSYILGSLMMIYTPPRFSWRACSFLLFSVYGCAALYYGKSNVGSYSHFTSYVLAGQILGTINYGLFRLESPHFSAATFKQRLKWAMDAYLNPRQIGTTSQPRNLSLFPITKFAHLTDPNVFVISRSLMAWFHYLLWGIVNDLQRDYHTHLQVGDYSPEKEQFFRRICHVTIREIGIRISLPVLWILPEILSISAHHYFISAVAVFIGGAKAIPGWNYPVYGLLTEAYTIRRYWGVFWHQFLRRDLIAWASFISSKLFRIPRNSRFNKIAMLYLVFFVSACMHAMIYIPAKMKFPNCGLRHIFQWYSLCPCAIIAEDLVQKWGKRVLRRYGWSNDSRWHYWIGYLWVWGFFAWSLPKFVFPKDDCVP